LVRLIVSHKTFYIVSFNFLRQSVQKGLLRPVFWGSPLM